MKIRSFIVSILLVALLVSSLSLFYSGIEDQYGVSVDSTTEAQFSSYNGTFGQIKNITEDMEDTVFDTSTSDSDADLLGKFLGGGFNVIKITVASLDAFATLADTAFEALGLPSFFKPILLTIVVVLLLFIVISVLVGKDI